MSILRTICCDVPGCTARAMELAANAGWPGWGQLTGVKIAEAENPVLCPEHLARAAEFVATVLAVEQHVMRVDERPSQSGHTAKEV